MPPSSKTLRPSRAASQRVVECDNLIVGAGPAGLQLGYHFGSTGRSYVILEAGDSAGGFFARFPRHRRLLSINKRFNAFPEPEFNLRHDWNSLLSDEDGPRFTAYSEELFPDADDLQRYLNDYARRFRLNIHYGSRVARIERSPGEGFVVGDERGDMHICRRVFLATGAVGPWIPGDIEGIELAEGYEDHSTEAPRYRNKRVAIIGRGNSAFEVANHIAGEAAIVHLFVGGRIRHAWNTHFAGDLRAINNTVLDMVQLKSLHLAMAFQVKRIGRLGTGQYEVTCETEFYNWEPPRRSTARLTYDHVIRCAGWRYADRSLFDDGLAPLTDAKGKFFTLSDSWETSVPDVYCIGTAMQSVDRQAASSFIHGFRYNVRTLFRLLEEKHYGVEYPRARFSLRTPADLERLAAVLIDRLSTTSALYQQFGVLCDAIAYRDGEAEVYWELPVAHVHQRPGLADADQLLTMTFQYGFQHYSQQASSLDFLLPVDPANPSCSPLLHPVFNHYRSGKMIEEIHLHDTMVVRYDLVTNHELGPRVDGHRNRIMNLLNRIANVCDEVFDEPTYSYKPRPELELDERRPAFDPDSDARCKLVLLP